MRTETDHDEGRTPGVRRRGVRALVRASFPLLLLVGSLGSALYLHTHGNSRLGIAPRSTQVATIPSLQDARPLIEVVHEKRPVESEPPVVPVMPQSAVVAPAPVTPPQTADVRPPAEPVPPLTLEKPLDAAPAPPPEPTKPVEAVPQPNASVEVPVPPKAPIAEVALPAAPTGPADKPPAPTPIAPPKPVATAPGPAPAAAVTVKLLERGKSLLGDGDIAGARLFLERAAEAGHAEAALLLGGTFDPVWLAAAGAHGTRPEPATARHWYAAARRLGSQEAEAHLARLGTGN